jgi:hypothetical protein
MKKLITAAFALTVLGVTLGASAADARMHRHKVCSWHRHHQVCRWR